MFQFYFWGSIGLKFFLLLISFNFALLPIYFFFQIRFILSQEFGQTLRMYKPLHNVLIVNETGNSLFDLIFAQSNFKSFIPSLTEIEVLGLPGFRKYPPGLLQHTFSLTIRMLFHKTGQPVLKNGKFGLPSSLFLIQVFRFEPSCDILWMDLQFAGLFYNVMSQTFGVWTFGCYFLPNFVHKLYLEPQSVFIVLFTTPLLRSAIQVPIWISQIEICDVEQLCHPFPQLHLQVDNALSRFAFHGTLHSVDLVRAHQLRVQDLVAEIADLGCDFRLDLSLEKGTINAPWPFLLSCFRL